MSSPEVAGVVSAPPYARTVEQVLAEHAVAQGVGLSAAQVDSLRTSYGANELAEVAAVPAWKRLLAQLNEPVVWLLVGAAIVSGALGEWVDSVAIVANCQALLPLLEKLPNVAGVSPMVSGAGLALRGEAVQAIALMGVDLDRYDRVVGLRSKVVSGTARLEPGESILGRELAQDLGVRVGDRLTVQTGQRSESLRVTALVDLGVKDLNRRTVIVPLRAAQNLLALPGGATSLDLTLNDVWVAQTMARDLRAQFPYKIESWQESNAQLVSALNAQSVSTSIIRGVVLAVVVLGIASVLVVSVVQKQREIGILRAMGATRGQVMRLFLVQGAVVGAVGSALGILLAVVLIFLFTRYVRGSDGLPLFDISLPPGTALQVALVATVCGVLAAIAPARRAARLDPAQAIRI